MIFQFQSMNTSFIPLRILWEQAMERIDNEQKQLSGCEKIFSEIAQNSQEIVCEEVSFLIKLQASRLPPY